MIENLKASIRVSGGTPAGMPDFKPLNLADPQKFKELAKKALRPPLFQVWVDWVGKGSVPVGPKCSLQIAQACASAIQTQIGLGRERTWDNPRVILA